MNTKPTRTKQIIFLLTILLLVVLIGSQSETEAAGAEVPCTLGFAGPYPCHNVDLLAYIPTNAVVGGTGADMWGWTDPATGVEYAIQTHNNAVSFVELSDPVNPVYLGYLPAPVPNLLWRDVKVYNNHAYVVGDGDFVVSHGLQIFDLTQLRNAGDVPQIFDTTATFLNFGNAHNIAINGDTGVAYVVGSNRCSGGLYMLGLQDPLNPVPLGCFSQDGYTHDTQCVVYTGPDAEHQGKEICFNANTDTITIVDVTDKSNPVQLSRTGYAGYGYVHQGWLTEDQAYFVSNDELDEQNNLHNTHTYIWDMHDLDAPILINTYVGPTTAIDHNLYIRDGYVFESNYMAGLRILDASDVANGNLTEVAYFDTHPASDAVVYGGNWSNYAFFESGIIAVSNIEDGLYILQPNLPGLEPDPVGGGQTTGGGWLAANDGNKINYGFGAESTGSGFEGDLQLNDKSADVKIRIDEITALGQVVDSADCDGIGGPDALEFHGNGTFNGSNGASFRVCVQDNSEPGKGSDQFYLACLSGCDYDTGQRTADNIIDGGNIQVSQAAGSGGGNSKEAATLILNPMLLSEGVAGQTQLFTVTAFDQDQDVQANAPITLVRTAANGTVESFSAVTDATGLATFTLVNLIWETEYMATSGSVESNTVAVSPLLQ